MEDAKRKSGRPMGPRDDPTMRYIAKHNLWTAVALQCGITIVAVRKWKRVPSERVRSVEAAIGRRRGLIRPDLYGRKAKHPENPAA